MKILITGATGFVGRHLIPSLYDMNNISHMLLVVRNIKKAKELFPFEKFDYCDITDVDKIHRFNPHIVIHLASKLTSNDDSEIIDDLIDSNIKYGVKLLDALKNCCKLKLFFNFGSFAEYRYGPDEISNAYLYSATKTAFKALLEYYSNLYDYKYIHIVPYSIYGGKSSQKKIMDYIEDALNNPDAIKMTGGEQCLDFIHISDILDFIKYLLEHPKVVQTFKSGEILHLGTGTATSIKELSKIIERKHNKKCNIQWGAIPYRKQDIMFAVAPIGKLLKCGWKSKVKLE